MQQAVPGFALPASARPAPRPPTILDSEILPLPQTAATRQTAAAQKAAAARQAATAVLETITVPDVDAVSDAVPDLSIQLARTDQQHGEAASLVKRRYAWRGYRVGGGPTDANSITLLARWGRRVVGTLTARLDSPTGLACAQLYPEQVAHLRAQGARLCEFTRLAVDDARHSARILATLCHVAFIYARQLQAATDLLIEVNPRHAAYYQRLLGFEQAGPLRRCPRVDAPAVLLRLALPKAEARLALAKAETQLRPSGQGAAAPDSSRSMYGYGFSPPERQQIVNQLRACN